MIVTLEPGFADTYYDKEKSLATAFFFDTN